jgi:hypothetical protein
MDNTPDQAASFAAHTLFRHISVEWHSDMAMTLVELP